jgi:hypothetical protein
MGANKKYRVSASVYPNNCIKQGSSGRVPLYNYSKRKGYLSFLAVFFLMFILVALVLANSSQNELSQLEQELIDSGYRWLVDYSGDDLYPKVEVYEKDGNEVLAVFNLTRYNESAFNEYKIFLTALGEGYSQDVFDLRSVCGSASIEGNLSGGARRAVRAVLSMTGLWIQR